MKYGFWLPIFGGWLRNVEDENMPPTFEYAKNVIQSAAQIPSMVNENGSDIPSIGGA